MKSIDSLRIAIACRWQHNGPGNQVLRAPTAAGAIKLVKSPDIERGAAQQDHGEGELAYDKQAAKARMTASSSHSAGATLQSIVHVQAQGEKRRRQTKSQRCDRCGSKRPSEDVPVEAKDNS